MRPKFLADHNLDDLIVDWLFDDEPVAEFVKARDIGLATAEAEEWPGRIEFIPF
jgi:hypothetical protein